MVSKLFFNSDEDAQSHPSGLDKVNEYAGFELVMLRVLQIAKS
jgi:hypothetical protein